MRSLPWLLLAAAAPAFPQITGASELIDADPRYAAIGRYRSGSSCTAFWIDTGGEPAYAVTAGHCVDLSPTRVHRNRADDGAVAFRYFRNTPAADRLTVNVRQVAYSTMKGLDVAILELDATRASLVSAGLHPLSVADAAPASGAPIEIYGVPVSGIPDDEQYLRRASCALGLAADLVEFTWHFWGAYRNTCSDIRGGSSGGPVVDRASGRVFAVLNTSTAGAEHATGGFICANGQPCEITRDGVRYLPDTNYAIPIAGLAHCFAGGRFDPALPACPLDPGVQLDFATPVSVAGASRPWGVALSPSGALAWYRYKTFAEGRDDCREAAGYSAPRRIADAPRIDEAIPATPGRHWLCVLAGPAEALDERWQAPRFATAVHVRIDTEPPTIPIPYTFRDEGDSLIFDPLFVVPELSNYRYKIGTAANGPCSDATGYQIYRRFQVRVPKAADLERFCLIGEDDAGNATPPLEIPLRGPQVLPEGARNAAALRSTPPGPIAPGSLITLYGPNLGVGDAATALLTDAAGAAHELRILYAGPGQINAYVPAAAALGPGRIEIATAVIAVTLQAVAPGVFTASQSGGGAPAGVEDLPAAPAARRLTFYTTGLARASTAHLTLGGQALEDVVVTPSPDFSGVEVVAARLPEDFRLAGYLPLELRVGDAKANVTFVRVRAK